MAGFTFRRTTSPWLTVREPSSMRANAVTSSPLLLLTAACRRTFTGFVLCWRRRTALTFPHSILTMHVLCRGVCSLQGTQGTFGKTLHLVVHRCSVACLHGGLSQADKADALVQRCMAPGQPLTELPLQVCPIACEYQGVLYTGTASGPDHACIFAKHSSSTWHVRGTRPGLEEASSSCRLSRKVSLFRVTRKAGPKKSEPRSRMNASSGSASLLAELRFTRTACGAGRT